MATSTTADQPGTVGHAGSILGGSAPVSAGALPGASSRHAKARINVLGYLLLLPGFALIGLFTLAPILHGSWMSLHSFDGVSPMRWVGLDNYREIVSDSDFRNALGQTGIYALGVVVFKNVVGLGLALLANQRLKGISIFRAMLFLPVTMSVVVIGAFWTFFLNGDDGLLNEILRAVGLGSFATNWLSNESTSMWSVIAVEVWRYAGLHMLILLAGLQTIDETLYEAARVDGASAWMRFRVVTVPSLRPIIFVSVLLALMGAFVRSFDLVWVLTRGGPGTEIVTTQVYNEAFQFQRFGRAAAMGFVLFTVVGAISAVYYRQAKGGRVDE